jgi:hypothetical protein
MIDNFLKYFSLIISIGGAIFFGRLQGKKNQQLKEINNSNEKLFKIIEIEKNIKNVNNADSAKFMFNEIKNG